ncbi:MAG: hypothetical protein OXU71_06315 [Gammaproteobacteria bacterium]|nr:hypothetical protein [Gammaproteobacteria bacterium]MDD9821974.1 hypothetical protein [Gammaproteobacteria bacterium]
MKTPQLDTVYKSYIDAYHAASILKKRDADADTLVRIEKAPYGDGYVVRSTPIFLETTFPMLGVGEPLASDWDTDSTRGYGGKR